MLVEEDASGRLVILNRGCREGKSRDFYLRLFEIYLPWLAIMLAGIPRGDGLNRTVVRDKAWVSLGFSTGLQVLFVAILVGTFKFAQLDASANVQPMAVTATPSSAYWCSSSSPPPAREAGAGDGAAHSPQRRSASALAAQGGG